MGALGIIFADGKVGQLEELVRVRTEASIPFGGRYRLIDFTLSSMVNADITQIAVITKRNYQSLMDHIGSGKEWDLSRKHGGVVIFPPFGSYQSESIFENSIEALMGIIGYIKKSSEENIVITSCNSVSIIDYNKVLRKHQKYGADITILYREEEAKDTTTLSLKLDDYKVVGAEFSKHSTNSAIKTYVFKRELFIKLVELASLKGATSFDQEFIINNIGKLNIIGFVHNDVYLPINSMASYYQNNMMLLNPEIRKEILESIPLYTKVRDSAPTMYGENSVVSNSLIADGCIIEGVVENSILFRGVKVAKGAIVKDCILMQDTIVKENVKLNAVITDKNVLISENKELTGCAKLPYFIGKSMNL